MKRTKFVVAYGPMLSVLLLGPAACMVEDEEDTFDDTAVGELEGLEGGERLAAPTSNWSFADGFGSTSGTVTWLNQSVGTRGGVCDKPASGTGSAQVLFQYFLDRDGSGFPYDQETRTINNACRSFNFTVDGPPGGIRNVRILLCDTGTSGCSPVAELIRP